MVDFTTQPPVTLDNGMVSVSFSATDGTYTLNDAIVVLAEQYAAMTPADIQADEQSRWDNWITIVNPPQEDVVDGQ